MHLEQVCLKHRTPLISGCLDFKISHVEEQGVLQEMTFTDIRLQHHQVNLGLHQDTKAFETEEVQALKDTAQQVYKCA